MGEAIFYWTGFWLAVGLVELALGSLHLLVWQRLWRARDDWWYFITWGAWKYRHRKREDRAAWLRHAAERMNYWADELENTEPKGNADEQH